MTLDSKSDESTKQTSETVHPEDATNQESDTTTREPQIISQIPPPPTDPPQTDQYTDDRTPQWKKYVEISAIAIAFGLLVVNIFVLCATKKAADAARDAATIADKTMKVAYRPRINLLSINESKEIFTRACCGHRNALASKMRMRDDKSY